MSELKIIEAVYYDPKLGPEKGTTVTRELSAQIKNGTLLYNGRYNDIFLDEFKRVDKKLFVRFEFERKTYEHLYAENEKIYLPFDQGLSTIPMTFINSDYVARDKIIQNGGNNKNINSEMPSQNGIVQLAIGVLAAVIAGFMLWYFGWV